MPAENILQSGRANKKHRMAAIEALFKKNTDQAYKFQALLLKKWIMEDSVSIPQNDNILWDAIRRKSSDTAYRWNGLFLLARKKKIHFKIQDDFLSDLLKLFTSQQQSATNPLEQKMALYFFTGFLEVASSEQKSLIFKSLIRALSYEDTIADHAWQILKDMRDIFPATKLECYIQECFKLIQSNTAFAKSEKRYMEYFLPKINDAAYINLLKLISKDSSQLEITTKKLSAWQFIDKKLSKEKVLSAFTFVWKYLHSKEPTIKKTAYETLAILLPLLSSSPRYFEQAIWEANQIFKHGLTGLYPLVLETVFKHNIALMARHKPKNIQQLLQFININPTNPTSLKITQLSFEILARAANYVDKDKQQQSIKVIIKIIKICKHNEIRQAAFNALHIFSSHLTDPQINDLFEQATKDNHDDVDFSLQTLIALNNVLTPERIAKAVEFIAKKDIHLLKGKLNLSDIVSLKLHFFTCLAKKLKRQYLEHVIDAISEGFEQNALTLAVSTLQLFLPQLDRNQFQLFFDKALAFLDAESPKQQSALEIIYCMSDYLSSLQIQQYMRKVGLELPKKLNAEAVSFYLKNKLQFFDRMNPEMQSLIIITLCQATHDTDYLIRSTAVDGLHDLILRGHIDKDDIENKLPKTENKFLNYFLTTYKQIKAEVSPTVSYEVSC